MTSNRGPLFYCGERELIWGVKSGSKAMQIYWKYQINLFNLLARNELNDLQLLGFIASLKQFQQFSTADFFQTQTLTWCLNPICTIFGGCIKCIQVIISYAKYIDFLH